MYVRNCRKLLLITLFSCVAGIVFGCVLGLAIIAALVFTIGAYIFQMGQAKYKGRYNVNIALKPIS